jgi:hypothetical protein
MIQNKFNKKTQTNIPVDSLDSLSRMTGSVGILYQILDIDRIYIWDAETNTFVDNSSATVVDNSITNIKVNVNAGIDATKIGDGSVSNAEYKTLDGVSSSIQTQINSKEASLPAGTTADYLRGDKTFQALNKTAVGLGNVPNTDATNLANDTIQGTFTPVNTAIETANNGKLAFEKTQGQINALASWIQLKEDVGNKTIVFQATPDNTKYPTEKLVKDNLDLKEALVNKDAINGYVGRSTGRVNFKNVAGTQTSYIQNSNTASRNYTFQNRDGTIVDDTDLATKIAKIPTAVSGNIPKFDANGEIIDSGVSSANLSFIDGEVNTHADLPDATTKNGESWLVKTTTGVIYVNRKVAGLYLSNGTVWTLYSPVKVDGYQEIISSPVANNIVAMDGNGQVKDSGVALSKIADKFDKTIAGEFVALTEKTSVVSNDAIVIEDSASSNSKKFVKFTSLHTSISNTFADRKTYYLSPSGDDARNGRVQETAVQTLAQALTLAGGSGNQIEVLAGTYSESTTITSLNVTISASNHETGSLANFTGTITANHASSSIRMNGLTIATLAHSGAGTLQMNNSSTGSGGLVISSNGYFQARSSDFTAGTTSITGSGYKNFENATALAQLTVNNAGAVVTIKNAQKVQPSGLASTITLTNGVLIIKNCDIIAFSSSYFALTATAGTLVLENVRFMNADGTDAKINIASGVMYSLNNVTYATTGTTIAGINIGGTAYFDKLSTRDFNLSSQTASRLAIIDANKNVISADTGTYPSLTELGYVKGTTSQIQTQLDSKLAGSRYNFTATTVPSSSNDSTQGYLVGSLWLNTSTNITYICTNATVSGATWVVLQPPSAPAITTASVPTLANANGGKIALNDSYETAMLKFASTRDPITITGSFNFNDTTYYASRFNGVKLRTTDLQTILNKPFGSFQGSWEVMTTIDTDFSATHTIKKQYATADGNVFAYRAVWATNATIDASLASQPWTRLNAQVHDGTERATGEYVNGKLVYSRYFSGILPLLSNAVQLVSPTTGLVRVNGWAKRTGWNQFQDLNQIFTSSSTRDVDISPVQYNYGGTGEIVLYNKPGGLYDSQYNLVVHYTKD